MANPGRYFEAIQIWEWIQWRLPPDLWLKAQQVLREESPPTPQDPALAAGLTELLDSRTTDARKLQLVQQLLTIIKNRS